MTRCGSVAFVLVGALFVAGACSGDDDDDDGAASTTTTTEASSSSETTTAPPTGATAADLCSGAVADPATPATVAQPVLKETSGVAVIAANDGVVWAHNDSGGEPEVFAIGADGADLGRYPLEGAEAGDWEDMALAGEQLILGDIGDNGANRPELTIYVVGEPDGPVAPGASLADVDAFPVQYADGPHDAETLLADATTGDLYIVTKEWAGGAAGVYRIPAERPGGGESIVMERVAEIPSLAGQLVTGGDISADGTLIALRTYADVLLWDRPVGTTVAEAFAAAEPCRAPAPLEVQGEALALDPDGRGYVTISEGDHPAINRYRLPG